MQDQANNKVRAGGSGRDALVAASLLERPFHPTAFFSLARAAHRARKRQFEARSRIDAIEEAERRLHAPYPTKGACKLDTLHVSSGTGRQSVNQEGHPGRLIARTNQRGHQ